MKKISEDSPDGDAPPDAIDFEPATILLVDDSLMNRELIRGYLKETSLRIIEAESGEHALYFLKLENRPDLILMDLRMPGRDGREVTEIIKSDPLLADIPVIAFTASTMKGEEEAARPLFDGCLVKPTSKAKLMETPGSFLRKRGSSCSNV